MSYVRIWLHCVWGTKKHYPFLTTDTKTEIVDHIRSNAITKGIHIDSLNGHTEHLHCLFLLGPEQSVSQVMQLIKGESSFWINKNNIVQGKFEWADEYFAVSASESQLGKVRNYIKGQEQHHMKKTWIQEYDEFIGAYGFQRIKD